MKLIMIVGQAGAGKTTAGQMLKKHGYIVLETGDIIRERFAREGRAGETILSFSERLFQEEGCDLNVDRYARIIYTQALNDRNAKGGVIIGLRTPLQIMRLSGLFTETYTVAVYASVETRFSRVKGRRRSDDPVNLVEFIREDFRELAWGLDTVLYETKEYIFNESTLDELERQLLSLSFLQD